MIILNEKYRLQPRQSSFSPVLTTERSAAPKERALADLYSANEKRVRAALSRGQAKFIRGEGSAEAAVMLIGEAPGLDEDRQGRPFIGRAGKLLNQWLAVVGLKREDVYITNTVKCHPMKNPKTPDARGNDRPPTPEEIKICWPIVKKEIEIIQPKIIVTLGSPATRTLLNSRDPITQICGRMFPFPENPAIQIFPLCHPAALFHNPNLKKLIERDLRTLAQALQSL